HQSNDWKALAITGMEISDDITYALALLGVQGRLAMISSPQHSSLTPLSPVPQQELIGSHDLPSLSSPRLQSLHDEVAVWLSRWGGTNCWNKINDACTHPSVERDARTQALRVDVCAHLAQGLDFKRRVRTILFCEPFYLTPVEWTTFTVAGMRISNDVT